MNALLLALAAGILTVAAPCVLPMLPIVMGTSIGRQNRARPAFIALGFTLTFSACVLVFGLFSESMGLSQQNLRDAATGLLILSGCLMVWKWPFDMLMIRAGTVLNRVHGVGTRAQPGNCGGFVVGMTLGAVWTPCAGPVLGAILALVVAERDLGRACALLLAYSAGAGIPMLLIAYGAQHISTKVRALIPYARRMQKVFGVSIVLTALAMHFQYDAAIAVWLSNPAAALWQR